MSNESEKKPKSAEIEDQTRSSSSTLVFVSHDNRDADLAEAFSKLLSSVSCGVLKSFRSSDRKGSQGIEYGVEWYPELMSKLTSASDVVCLLTHRSLDRPWILYEAGVAKGKLNTPVYGIALGIPLSSANAGPFAQFQNCDDDDESLTKLVMQLVRKIPNAEPDHDAIQLQVKGFKQKSAVILKAVAESKEKKPEKHDVDGTSVAKLFEEVKIMFKDLPSRLESKGGGGSNALLRRQRRIHPGMLEELMRMSFRRDDPFAVYILLSVVREDFPWLYEFADPIATALRNSHFEKAHHLFKSFVEAWEFTMERPGLEAFAASDEAIVFYRSLGQLVPSMLHRLISETNARRPEKKEN